MLLTGQASVLTGAPGSVLFYALLALVLLPRTSRGVDKNTFRGILSRHQLKLILGGFWIFAALLQLQPYWWQAKQISQQVSALASSGTLSSVILNPSLNWFSNLTANGEVVWNIAYIVVFAVLGVGILLSKASTIRPWLIATIVVSLVLWWFNQALGMTLTGMATDPNSAPLVILVALACWPVLESRQPIAKREDKQEPQRVPVVSL